MKRATSYTLGALLGLAMSSSALAAADGYYAQAGLGWAHASTSNSDTSTAATKVDNNDWGYRVGGGYQVNSNFAIEANYLNFGRYKYKSNTSSADGSVKTEALNADVVGILPLADQFSTNVKVGGYHSFVSRANGMSFSDAPNNQWGVDYGLGANYYFNPNLGLGVSWIQLLQDRKNSLLTADVTYHFG